MERLVDIGENVLDLILNALQDLVDFELAVILKLSDPHMLVVQKATGPQVHPGLEEYQIDLRQRTDIARLIDRNEPYLFAENEEHIDTYADILDFPDGHSCMVAPLYLNDSPIGLLTLDHRACGRFSPAIVRFIGTIAHLIAIIIAQDDSGRYLDSVRKKLTHERNALLKASRGEFKNLIGESNAWKIVLELIKTVAGSELPVLIHGETGTGKEQTAGTIHRLSLRSDGPFITLNCSALNANLAESELFGHEKGAFTSAVNSRRGRFELADGGTLFLDEIADLPAEIQPKLLRILQEGTYERVGGERTRNCNVRIIAASNKDLKTEVKEGRFREDLYYRLGVFPISLPPLREREDDSLLLADFFIQDIRKEIGYADLELGSDAIEGILNYSWPGNVRELQNVMKRSALVARGKMIRVNHLNLIPHSSADPIPTLPPPDLQETFPTLEEVEKLHIIRALNLSRGKIYGKEGAAEHLGLKPTTLQSRIKKLGIKK